MTNKIAMIIASNKFRDEEYADPKNVFESSGFSVTTASSTLNPCTGMMGGIVKPDILYTSVDPQDYDAVIFVGGGGSREYFDDADAQGIAKKTLAANRVLGAICIAPSILANAGLLKGKKATVFSSQAENLLEKGACVMPDNVVRDGNIVTGNGPGAGDRFGELVVDTIRSV